jgi:glycosyltransferase involved in cell wall biosynthesis
MRVLERGGHSDRKVLEQVPASNEPRPSLHLLDACTSAAVSGVGAKDGASRAWRASVSSPSRTGTADYHLPVLNAKRVTVILPAYNAELTLKRTVDELDRAVVDDMVLVDDASTDKTIEVAEALGLTALRHSINLGYGGNQKTCYRTALGLGADIVVMMHPDYQYSPLLVPAIAAMIAYGEYDLVLGSRILAQNAVARGMPRYKYVSNRGLTLVENLLTGQKLSEYHTGLRAYSRELLAALPLDRNSDDFVFDNQIIVQALAAGARIGELSCPTRYHTEASSIGLARSIRYGIGVLRTAAQYRLQINGLRSFRYLEVSAIERGALATPTAATGTKATCT